MGFKLLHFEPDDSYGICYDFTGDSKYLDGMFDGISYLLGRNAMDQSYVTGYGERPLQNPHDRFWTPQTSKRFPAPPRV